MFAIANVIVHLFLFPSFDAPIPSHGHHFRAESSISDQQSCDTISVDRALASDTANMRRSVVKFAPEDNTNGASQTVYFSTVNIPRVIVIVYLGETGRLVETDRKSVV